MPIRLFFGLILLGLSAPPRAEDPNQALFAAAAGGQVERVNTLLAGGADVNAKNSAGRTPLMMAASSGNVRILKKLLAFGADPNAADGRGVTALMEASGSGFEDAVRVLIAAGADVALKDAAGNTVLDRMKKIDNPRIAAILEKAAPAPPPPPPPAEKAEGTEQPEGEPAGAEEEKAEDGDKKE
jgi:ankyrin repeat protein